MSMLRELENLLRDITEQQPAQGKPRPRPSRPPAQQQPIQYLDAEIVEAEPVHEGVAEHVSHHLDTRDVTSRAAQLGAEVGLSDDKLEALPAGQKMLLRMGSANAARVKAKLAEIREALLAGE